MVMYVDYLVIYYRDLGHFLMREDYLIQDYIGYLLSSLLLTMMIYEFEKIYRKVKESYDLKKS